MIDEASRSSQEWQRNLPKGLQHAYQSLMVGGVTAKLINHYGAQVEETRVMVDAIDIH